MIESQIHNLVIKFLKKETTEGENEKILNWVSESNENRAEFRSIHETYHLSHLKQYQSEIEIEEAWNNLHRRMPQEPIKNRKLNSKLFWRVAASVAIILAVGVSSFWSGRHLFNQRNNRIVKVEAPAGEKSKVLLADGTQVWLNSGSGLIYNTSDPREVWLDGEAYFEVKKDKAHPFEVATSSGMKVTVLGTKFNLRTYDDEKNVETTLDEGKIVITGVNQYKPVVLNPGQQANYNLQNGKLVVRNVDGEVYSLWKNNVLRFSDISFAELAPRIERWYGVSIDLDSLVSNTDRFTMTIKTESLRELLNMMQLTSNFKYDINGDKVKIKAY